MSEASLTTTQHKLTLWQGALLLASLLLFVSEALALGPQDLIVVFNSRLPESQEVASYYAKKRKVPSANLLGVDLPTSESITRQTFEQNLVPPIRQAVIELKKRGQTPAVLLVFGMPLRVEGPVGNETERQFRGLIETKVQESLGKVLTSSRRLDFLVGGEKSSSAADGEKSADPEAVLKKVRAAITRAITYLTHTPEEPGNLETREEINSLILKLLGVAGKARSIVADLEIARVPDQATPSLQDLYAQYMLHHPELTRTFFWGILPEKALTQAKSIAVMDGQVGELQFWLAAQRLMKNPQTQAAVDSELTLMQVDRYQRALWLPNPFLPKYDKELFIKEIREQTVMVGRLDGPTPMVARRLVDDALAAERTGLKGVFYIDARGIKGDTRYGGYAWYDHHLVKLYHIVSHQSSLKVVLDQLPQVFPPGSCPEAALYCGWYSLAKYVPAFRWQRGAVAYHVASAEATTLKQPNSQVWCKRLLEEGVAATLGPVSEPYLAAFPLPDEFFPLLMTGRRPLLEVYFRTLPHLSWRLLLIGDPLYRPFQKNPALKSPG